MNLSVASNNLTCLGAVYNANGTEVLGPNTIWVPYTMESTTTLHLGNNTMDQAGFLLVAGNGTSLATAGNLSEFQYMKFSSGWRFDVLSMYYQGQPAAMSP